MISSSTQPSRNYESMQIFDILDLSGRLMPQTVTKVTKRLSARLQFDNPSIPKFCMLTCNSLILGVDNIQNQEYLPQRKKSILVFASPKDLLANRFGRDSSFLMIHADFLDCANHAGTD
jgi:hypothetical protein